MRIHTVETRRIVLPLRTPFRTASTTTTVRELLLVRLETSSGEGWGECAALAEPTYTSEWTRGAEAVTVDVLAPALLAVDDIDAATVMTVLRRVIGHPMAKTALELAVLDAQLRADDTSLASALGATRSSIPAGAVVGVADSIDSLVDEVAQRVGEGYRAIKLKIRPGWDVEPATAVRAAFGALEVGVDANAGYTIADLEHLRGLDALSLAYLEQPFAPDDVAGHAAAAGRLDTPICLDESIDGLEAAAAALDAGAGGMLSIKPGRVGGVLAAKALHDWAGDRGVPMRVGGMLEAGVGRAAAVALGALDGFTVTGDLSGADRYFESDIVSAPLAVEDGELRVPTAGGLGVVVDLDVVDDATVATHLIRR